MPRPPLILPRESVLGISDMLQMGWNQKQIAEYYNNHEYFVRLGVTISQQRISDHIARFELKENEQEDK